MSRLEDKEFACRVRPRHRGPMRPRAGATRVAGRVNFKDSPTGRAVTSDIPPKSPGQYRQTGDILIWAPTAGKRIAFPYGKITPLQGEAWRGALE